MENKKVVGAGKIISDLIAGWFLYGIIFGVLYRVIYTKLVAPIDSLVMIALIAIVLQGIVGLLCWKCSTNSAFKKRTMDINEVPKVMKGLVIFTIIVCVITWILNYSKVDQQVDRYVKYNSELMVKEAYMDILYDDDELKEYYEKKDEAIKDVKSQLYTYLIILEVGLTGVYLLILIIVKKDIVKKITEG